MAKRIYPYIGQYKLKNSMFGSMFSGLTIRFTEPGKGAVLKAAPENSAYPVGLIRDDWSEDNFEPIGSYITIDTSIKKEDTLVKGDLIIGSIHKTTGALSFSANPKVQPNFLTASQEAERLAKLNTEKKFVVVEVKGIVSVNNVAWE